MERMSQEELDERILKHKKWTSKRRGGEKLKIENRSLYGLSIKDCKLVDAEITNCLFNKVTMEKVWFSQSILHGCEYRDSKIMFCNFNNAEMIRSTFIRTKVSSDFMNTDLFKSKFFDSYFAGSCLSDAILQCVRGSRSDFSKCNLRKAKLDGADFSQCSFKDVSFLNAVLVDANITSSNIDGADFSNANLAHATLPERVMQLGPIGSRNDYIIFWADKNLILCGCWNNYDGGTLEEFEKRVHETYKEQSNPYRLQYEAAIAMFKMIKKA